VRFGKRVEVKGHKIEPRAQLAAANLAHSALQGGNLEGANLSNANLAGAQLNGANLTDANLVGADLSSANLQGAILQNADLSGANLTDASIDAILHLDNPELLKPNQLDFSKAKLIRVDLSGSNLTGANLTRANMTSVDASGARLCGATLEKTQLQNAIFRDANLEGVDLTGKDLKLVDFADANLQQARLAESNLQGAVLRNVNAKGANFEYANLKTADCSNANLEDAKLSNSNLSKTILQSANLRRADLSKSMVDRTNFKGAQLEDAIFENAKFNFPDFTGASGVQEAFVKEAGRFVSKKTQKRLAITLVALLVVFSIGAVLRNIQAGKREQALLEVNTEASALTDKYCSDVKALTGEDNIKESYRQFERDLRSIRDIDVIGYSVRNYDDLAWGCRDDALDQYTPKTVPRTVPKPAAASDAELAAEGRSCSQQWERASAETRRGGSSDVQLRGTVYACDTPGDWALGAIDNGEYSEFLLDVICAVEGRAPACN